MLPESAPINPTDYFTAVETALEGAAYHEEQAFSLITPNAKGEIQKKKYQAVIHHLRSYYWELWSVWDYLLHNANDHTLALPYQEVNSRLLERLRKEAHSYKYLADLERIYADPWFKRIRRLRHYSHTWVLRPYQFSYSQQGVTVICLLMSDKPTPEQINVDRNDLWFMKEQVTRLRDVGFF